VQISVNSWNGEKQQPLSIAHVEAFQSASKTAKSKEEQHHEIK
jgi:hypothetical protein